MSVDKCSLMIYGAQSVQITFLNCLHRKVTNATRILIGQKPIYTLHNTVFMKKVAHRGTLKIIIF